MEYSCALLPIVVFFAIRRLTQQDKSQSLIFGMKKAESVTLPSVLHFLSTGSLLFVASYPYQTHKAKTQEKQGGWLGNARDIIGVCHRRLTRRVGDLRSSELPAATTGREARKGVCGTAEI